MFTVSSGFYRTVAWEIMPSSETPPERGLTMWEGYQSPGCWDELLIDGHPRHACEGVVRYLMSLGGELAGRQEAAELAIRSMGITFTVYTEASNIDQAWPFDVIPRVVSTQEWERISRGLVQRLTALNLFIDDIYGAARVVADGVVPAEVLSSSLNFRPECRGAGHVMVCGPTFAVATWSGMRTGRCTCSRTTCGSHRASRTCSKTGW